MEKEKSYGLTYLISENIISNSKNKYFIKLIIVLQTFWFKIWNPGLSIIKSVETLPD